MPPKSKEIKLVYFIIITLLLVGLVPLVLTGWFLSEKSGRELQAVENRYGYTRSITALINPAVGLDAIKHLGFDYVKILLMCLVLAVFTFIVSLILGIIFSPFDLPQIGNLPLVAIASLFHFYIWIVFSIILGFALYKNSSRLNLFQIKSEWSAANESK